MSQNSNPSAPSLDADALKVVNIGLDLFTEALQAQQVPVAQVDWEPPARGDAELIDLLDDLL